MSLIPWVLFTIIAGRAGANFVGWAAVVAAVVTFGIAVKGTRDLTPKGTRSSVKVIDVAGVLTFIVMAVLAFTGSHGVRQHIVNYGRGACALVLALVMLGSLLFVPFTEQYARESVPQEYWDSPVFRAINRQISAAFAIAILLMAVSHFYSGYRESQHDLSQRLNLVLNWGVPVVVILAAIRYTSRITSDSGEPSRSGSGSTSA